MQTRPQIGTQTGTGHRRINRTLGHIPIIAACLLLVCAAIFVSGTSSVSAQSPCGNTVTVVFGDTFQDIAERCNTSEELLLRANPTIDPESLEVGEVLVIPSETDPNAPIIYEVQRGDWLSRIAIRYNTSVSAILASNPQIINPDRIEVGQEILIPLTGDSLNPSVVIAPNGGPPSSIIEVTTIGYPPNTELIIGLGEPASEPFVSNRVTTNAQGATITSFTVPEDAEPNQRYTVVAYVPGPGGARATSSDFIVTSGSDAPPGDQPVQIQIMPTTGTPGTSVQITAIGLPANSIIEIGTGPVDSEYDIIAMAQTNAQGELNRTVSIPERAQPGTRWIIALTPAGSSADYLSNPFEVRQPSEGEDSEALFTRTNIYLIALEDAGRSGMQVGCSDSVVPVEVQIEPTLGVLRAAMESLVNLGERFYGQSGLYNALYRSNLNVDEVMIQDSTAIVRLSGQVSLGGVCDTPRLKAQLRQTALQYSTVDDVQIFVNGEPLDSVIQ